MYPWYKEVKISLTKMAVDGRKLMDTLSHGSDIFHEQPCSPCAKDNRNVEAIKYCIDCEENICGKCESDHKRFAGMRGHQIEDKPRSQTGQKRPDLPTQKCDKHGGKLIDLYCSTHDVVGCSTCVAIEHSTCKEKFYVPEYIKNKPQVTDDRDIAAQLDKLTNNLGELQKNIVTEKEKLAYSKEKLKKIQRFRKEINLRLDELEKDSVKQLEKRFQSLIEKIEAGLREIRESTKALESASKNLKSAGDNMSQAFASIKIARGVASEATDMITTTKQKVFPSDISFDADQKLQSLFYEVQNLGCIKFKENVQLQPKSSDSLLQEFRIQADRASSASQSSFPSLLRTKGKKKVKVKVKSEENPCSIWSACTLDDGTIILCDINNYKLKRLDGLSYNITDFCDVPKWPLQVCAVSNMEVVVCCSVSKLVQFVSVGRTLQKTREIRTEFECRGISHANGKLYVSDYESVYVYTIAGERLQNFSKDHSGHQIFSVINSLAFSSDNTKIYVADGGNGLIILDTSFQIVGNYKGPKFEAIAACWHTNCGVLVSGGEFQNVVQLSPYGQLIGEVLKTNTWCRAVCCNRDFSKLIVGLGNTDEIEVYDIQ